MVFKHDFYAVWYSKPQLILITFYVDSPYISDMHNTHPAKINMWKIMFPGGGTPHRFLMQ